MTIDRRSLLAGAALAGAAAPAVASAAAAAQTPAPAASPGPVTATLARYCSAGAYADLPAPVRKEAVRTLLNWVGCAVGGSRHETLDRAVAAMGPFSGKAEATVLGRKERFDPLTTALMNGVSSHIFDYDDTHLKTIIHPAGPVASALLALAERKKGVSGQEFLNAMILGVEAECRIGNAVYPEHYEMGWHITGSAGSFGSAVACGRLLGLSPQQMAWAIGIAASQPVGLKIQFGSMTKSFHPGRAAQNGLTAALLAQQGYTSADATLEGRDGWGQALSTKRNWAEVTEGLGTRYEAALNTYKPFACGIVTHPAIDAAIQLRNENNIIPLQIAAIELHANPLVMSLTGRPDPADGLGGKFSISHCIAAGLIDGAAGERQFSDAKVKDPVWVALRHKVIVRTDPAVPPQKCDLTVRLQDGRTFTKHIENAIGSLEKPMSDQALEAKFADLADGVIAKDRARRLMDLCWKVETLADVSEIARAGAA